MKYLLLLLPIVLISLCSMLPEIPLPAQPEIFTIDMGSPDIFIKVETVSSIIKGGREAQIYFELRNKQPYDLKNVVFNVYDRPCFDIAANSGKFEKDDCGSSGTLKPNQTCLWFWRWESTTSDIDRQCLIKFSTSYEATNSVFQDIAVLPKAEYLQREIEGTLQDVPIQSTSAKGPLKVYLTFSEPQPLMAEQGELLEYTMYINYNNIGNGLAEKTDVEPFIRLTVPNNIENLDCDGYSDNELEDPPTFIKGRAVSTNCDFVISEKPAIDIKSLGIDINYRYIIYNSIPITVKGTEPSTPEAGGGGGGGPGGCLIGGSKVLTPEGFKRIEDLKVGDIAIGYKDGKITPTKIYKTSSHKGKWTLYYYEGIWFTSNHKIYPSLDDEEVLVSSLSTQTEEYEGIVYNVETETHNFFGENGLLIHNFKPIA